MKIFQIKTLLLWILTVPIAAQAALIFQYDYNDGTGTSTLDTQFPDTPAITGTQRNPGDPVTFEPDVPNVHSGGFSGNYPRPGATPASQLQFNMGSGFANGMTEMTWSMWIKPDSSPPVGGPTMRFLHIGGGFWFQRTSTSNLQFKFASEGTPLNIALDTPDDQWTFIALTYDGTDFTSYSRAEGAPSFTTNNITAAGKSSTTAGTTLFTGHPGSINQSLYGNVDNLRIYDNALSSIELDNVYAYNDVIIPEPSQYAFVIGLIFILGSYWYRKRL